MIDCQRHLFSLPDDVHYINGAYMSPLAKRAVEAGFAGIEQKTLPHLVTSAMYFQDSEKLRALFAQLINAPTPNSIAIIPSVSYGLSIIANNLAYKPGQNIVIISDIFPSSFYTWSNFCKKHDLTLKIVAPPTEFHERGKIWNERILDAIDNNTALVSIEPLHWADGTLFDTEAIGKRAHEVGGIFVLDATQALGALPFDIQKVNADAVLCAAYKWLLGPYSIGAAYFGEYFANSMPLEQGWMNRLGADNFQQLTEYEERYVEGTKYLSVGETSNFALTPMMAAGISQLLDFGVANIQEYCRNLTAEYVAELRSKGFWIEDDAWHAAHLFGIRLPEGVSSNHILTELQKRKVFVSLRAAGMIRISPNIYNSKRDMDAFMDALYAGMSA